MGAEAFSANSEDKVEISMLALLRLACYSFLFGGGMLFSCLLVRLLFRVISPLPEGFPLELRERLRKKYGMSGKRSRRHPNQGAAGRFLLDLFLPLFIAVAMILFLFQYGDGIPRLFVFLSAGGGALLTYRTIGRRLPTLETRVVFFTRMLFFSFCMPIASIVVKIGRAFLSFLRKVGGFFIKRLERQNTKLRARRYERTAPRTLTGKRIRKRLLAAIEPSKKEKPK